MRLDSIVIENFRSIRNPLELSLRDISILAGHNDAGKSSILAAIRFLLRELNVTQDDVSYGAESDLSVTGEFTLTTDEQSELATGNCIKLRRSFDGQATNFEHWQAVPSDQTLRNLESKLAPELVELSKTHELDPASNKKADVLKSLIEFSQNQPHVFEWGEASRSVLDLLPLVLRFDSREITEPDAAIKASLDVRYKTLLQSDKFSGSIADIERAIEQELEVAGEELRSHIQETVPDAGEVHITPHVSFRGSLTGTDVRFVTDSGADVALANTGAGRARRIALAVWEKTTALLEGASNIIALYDEPDAHLDYLHQRRFISQLKRRTANAAVQAVIATHSMNMIDGVDIADVVHVRLDKNGFTSRDSLVDDSEIGSHLGDIASALGLRNTVLLNERLFVCVEGPSETRSFPILFRKTMGLPLPSFGISMWESGGHVGALRFASYLKAHGRQVRFIVDTDATDLKEFSPKAIEKAGFTANESIYIGRREFEDLFSDDCWARIANQIWRKDDIDAVWGPEEFGGHRAGKKFSASVFEMLCNYSSTAPSGKPEMTELLSLHLEEKELPEELAACFKKLVELANSAE